MRLGLIARADNRGLGQQTWAVQRNLHPAKTMVVDCPSMQPLQLHTDRFPGAHIVRGLPTEVDYAQFLEGINALQELQDDQLVQLFIDPQEEIVAGPFPDPPNAPDLAIKAVEMELEVRKESEGFCLIRKTNQPMLAIDPSAKLNPAWDTFCRCFHVDPEARTLKITTEELPPFSDENGPRLELLDLETRSLLQVLFFVSHGIDVPNQHVLDRKAGHRGHHQNDAAQIVPHASDRQPFFAGMP
jgi:hypothetical protein